MVFNLNYSRAEIAAENGNLLLQFFYELAMAGLPPRNK